MLYEHDDKLKRVHHCEKAGKFGIVIKGFVAACSLKFIAYAIQIYAL